MLCMNANRYKSVEPDSLFDAFEMTVSEYQYEFGSTFTITDFMKKWTEQAGYPMINVVKVNDSFILTQVRI